MARYKSSSYGKKAYISSKIRNFYRHKAAAELIPENSNVFVPKVKADAVIIIRLRGHPQMQFSSYRTPWNSWTISPTLAGQKIQQAMIGYAATP
jgi:hypothetical protein